MQTKRIPSPVRTIQLDYEETKPFSPYETELIDRYVEIHSIHANYDKSIVLYQRSLELLDESIAEARGMLEKTRRQLKHLLHSASALSGGVDRLDDARVEELQEETESYNRSVGAFYKRLCKADEEESETVNKCSEFYVEWQDEFEEQLEEFDDFEDQLYENDRECQLDVDRFYMDHDEFRACLSVTDKKMTTLWNNMEAVSERWQALANEANLFFDFVNNQNSFRAFGSVEMLN